MTATSVGRLPAPVADPATVALDANRVVLLGGLTPADTSTASVTILDGGAAKPAGALPTAQHDAQAARLGPYAYVFGGGQSSTYDHILRYDPATSSVTQVGTLPAPASDVAVASLNGTAYVVGGYDGTNWLTTILAWSPGGSPHVAARLPFGLRYSAAAAVGGRLIIAGGTTPAGISDEILSFDPATGSVTKIGALPTPLTHASAAPLDGYLLVIGGRRQLSGAQTAAIFAVDPSTGSTRQVGALPQPLSDAGAASLPTSVVIAGGQGPAGVQSQVLELIATR